MPKEMFRDGGLPRLDFYAGLLQPQGS